MSGGFDKRSEKSVAISEGEKLDVSSWVGSNWADVVPTRVPLLVEVVAPTGMNSW